MKNGYWIAVAAASLLMTPRVQPRNQMKLPSFHGIAEVRASIPGRIRLYMPAVKANPEVAAQMKKQMEETGAVHEVSINPVTGTVLILYDEAQVEASVVEGAAIRLMGLDEVIQRQPVSKMEKCLQTLWDSIVVRLNPLCGPSSCLSICIWGMMISSRSRKPMPIRNPIDAGRKESVPMAELLSSAGCSRLQKEAATITPAANPVRAFCTTLEISFFRKKTIAAPRLVPRNGIRIPSASCMFIFPSVLLHLSANSLK